MAAKTSNPSPSTSTKKTPSRTASQKAPAKSASKTPAAPKTDTEPAKKKSSTSRTAPKKSPSKKAPAQKSSAKKAPAKTPVRKKTSATAKKKSSAASENGISAATSLSAAAKRIQERERLRKKRLSDRISERVAARAAANGNGDRPVLTAAKKGKPLTARDLTKFRKLLLDFRDRIVGDISFLTDDSLHRPGRDTGADLSGASQHSADHGTDNFDREFALSLASTEQDVLYEVDEALQRIEDGTYGVCEMTGVYIEKARLEVIPYTRYSVQAQAKMEQGRARYRPFGQTFRGW